jgi:hypothetical protein
MPHHDTTWTWVAERGTNVCNECGVTWFAMDYNDPTGTVCNYCVEDRERA